MAVLPLSKLPMDFDSHTYTQTAPPDPEEECVNWLRYAAAATLVASGALLLSGNKRAGLAVAATGTALALIDHKETLKEWWALLPGYISDAQRVLTQISETVDEVAVQTEKLGRTFAR
jgi:hypothetical protein